jgi:hypothetical protein
MNYNLLTLLLILASTAVFFVLNMLTPFWWDDFIMACYIEDFEGKHARLLLNFDDIIASTINMHKTHHGRSIVDFVNFLFMFSKDKNLFNASNALVYGVFIFLMCFHVAGSVKEIRPAHILCANALLWLFLISYGQNMLWLTGALNYLWTGTAVLLFLIPFRKRLVNFDYSPPLVISMLWLFAGVLCGWSIENSAIGTLLLLIWYFALKRKHKEKVTLFEITGTVGFLLGLFMLLSTGKGFFPGFFGLIGNFIKVVAQFVSKDLILLTIIAAISAELVYFKKKKIPVSAVFFLVVALGSVAAMVIPGYFRGRSTFITQVFLIMTAMSIFFELSKYIDKRFIVTSYIVLVFAFLPSFIDGVNSIFGGYLFSAAREHYILQEKAKGNLNISVKTPIPAIDSHSGLYGGIDVQTDSTSSDSRNRLYYYTHNSAKATWYGLESLDGILTAAIVSHMAREKSEMVFEPIKYYFGIANSKDKKDLFMAVYENWE